MYLTFIMHNLANWDYFYVCRRDRDNPLPSPSCDSDYHMECCLLVPSAYYAWVAWMQHYLDSNLLSGIYVGAKRSNQEHGLWMRRDSGSWHGKRKRKNISSNDSERQRVHVAQSICISQLCMIIVLHDKRQLQIKSLFFFSSLISTMQYHPK